jgi:CubicO group peptidase (beta-lactamase class C family)
MAKMNRPRLAGSKPRKAKPPLAAQRIEAALQAAVEGGLPGVSAAARLADGSVVEAAAGLRGLDSEAPMTPDTVFWVASFVKAVTAAAALQLCSEGRLDLDEPVGPRLPMLAAPWLLSGFGEDGVPLLRQASEPITLRRLLAHTSGLAYEFCNAKLARYAAVGGQRINSEAPEIPVLFEPGSAWTYGIGNDWTGKLIEAVAGERFDHRLRWSIFEPLGMADATFQLNADQAARKASMHRRGEDDRISAMPFELRPPPNFAMGGAGLFSTARDYLRFLEALLGGGGKILDPQHARLMFEPQASGPDVGVLPGINRKLCAGFDPFPGRPKQWSFAGVVNPAPWPDGRGRGSAAWAGIANCYYWVDVERGVAGVMLTQILPLGDAQALEAFAAFERAVYGVSSPERLEDDQLPLRFLDPEASRS